GEREVRRDALSAPGAGGGADRARPARGEEHAGAHRGTPRRRDAPGGMSPSPGRSPGAFLQLPDLLAAWIRMERMTRRAIGRRMEDGPTPATDAALDRLIGLRAWLARRLSG